MVILQCYWLVKILATVMWEVGSRHQTIHCMVSDIVRQASFIQSHNNYIA